MLRRPAFRLFTQYRPLVTRSGLHAIKYGPLSVGQWFSRSHRVVGKATPHDDNDHVPFDPVQSHEAPPSVTNHRTTIHQCAIDSPDFFTVDSPARILQWYVKVGDTVKQDQALGVVEWEKWPIDVHALLPGKIIALRDEGTEVPPTEPIISIRYDSWLSIAKHNRRK